MTGTMALLSSHMKREADRFDPSERVERAFALTGVLVGSACPAPLGLESMLTAQGFQLVVTRGAQLSEETVREAVRVANISRLAADAVLDMQSAWSSDEDRSQDAQVWLEDGVTLLDAERYAFVGAALHAWRADRGASRPNPVVPIVGADAREGIAALRELFTRRDGESSGSLLWQGYVACCAHVLSSHATQEPHSTGPTRSWRPARPSTQQPHLAIPIGRSRKQESASASIGSWDVDVPAGRSSDEGGEGSRRLRLLAPRVSTVALALPPQEADNPILARCTASARLFFADEFDALAFSAVVGRSRGLYTRLERLTRSVQQATREVVESNPGGVFYHPRGAAEAVRACRVRIAGAPRGTWAGRTTDDAHDAELRVDTPSSSMGPGELLLLQAAHVISSHLWLAQRRTDPCEHPPLWSPLSTNAYHLHPFRCVVLFPGILRRPFADGAYDEASMTNRIGAVVAHELAHATDYLSNPSRRFSLLAAMYPHASTHVEAMADVVASLAAVRMGGTSRQAARRFALDWAQLWCGRPVAAFVERSTELHPNPNHRATALCAVWGRVSNISCSA